MNQFRLGLRILRKQPLFTLAALATLAIGVGANITIFSFVNAFLLRPLPIPDADRLVSLYPENKSFGSMSVAYQNFLDWRERSDAMEVFGCYRQESATLTGIDLPERLPVMRSNADLLSMIGTQPFLGRLFFKEADQPQTAPTAVLSHGFWQRMMGSDPSVIGKAITLEGISYSVVGVLPQGFQFPGARLPVADVWLPTGPLLHEKDFLKRWNHSGFSAIAKRKPGMTFEQGKADMKRVMEQLKEEYPDAHGSNTLRVVDFHENLTKFVRPVMTMLMVAVGCVLLIVCVNVAGLLLVRAARRANEFSIRASLGARRWQLISQLFCENMILALLGSVAGLVVAWWGSRMLFSAVGDVSGLTESPAILLDHNMAWFFAAITLVSVVLFSLFPIIQSTLAATRNITSSNARAMTASRGQQRVRSALVIAQIAMALAFLSCAGLLVRSYQAYLKADPGYNAESTLTMQLSLPKAEYDSDEKRTQFYQALEEKIAALPGVNHVAMSSTLLGRSQRGYGVENAPSEPGQSPHAEYCAITADYIAAMGMRLQSGRLLTDRDGESAQRVALVDERFVERWWPNENPLGKRFQFGSLRPDGTWFEVVGVVNHVKPYGIDQDSRESVYVSAYQDPFTKPNLIVRTDVAPLTLVAPIRNAISEIDPNLAPSKIRTLQRIAEDQAFSRRILVAMISVFALAALILAGVGIYGVTAYAVSQRRQEFGIRLALGAASGDILLLVLSGGAKTAAIGVLIGLVLAFSLGALVRGQLYSVAAADPTTFILTTLLVLFAVALACVIPALRATMTDPLKELRTD